MTTDGQRPRPRRTRAWLIAAVVVIGVALAAWAMSSLIVSGNSGASTAIAQVKDAAAPGLADLERAAARRDQRLDVGWSAVPSPRGGAHMVTVRLELLPSGEVASAGFVVTDGRVLPQDPVARRLVGGTGAQ